MIPLPAMFRKEKPTIAMLLVVKDCQQQEYDYEKSKSQTKTESKTPYNTIKQNELQKNLILVRYLHSRYTFQHFKERW